MGSMGDELGKYLERLKRRKFHASSSTLTMNGRDGGDGGDGGEKEKKKRRK